MSSLLEQSNTPKILIPQTFFLLNVWRLDQVDQTTPKYDFHWGLTSILGEKLVMTNLFQNVTSIF